MVFDYISVMALIAENPAEAENIYIAKLMKAIKTASGGGKAGADALPESIKERVKTLFELVTGPLKSSSRDEIDFLKKNYADLEANLISSCVEELSELEKVSTVAKEKVSTAAEAATEKGFSSELNYYQRLDVDIN
ncbi:MAG TPA: hypothetical protein VD770_01945, partial [Coxiellaceae bacterium]|nr:hypothetical protein [Coxiellaceae bacterium]